MKHRREAQNERRKKARLDLLPAVIDPIDPDFLAALRTWIAFGGLGGRTRRGCGAIHINDPTFVATSLPKLEARIFLGPAESDAVAAWGQAVQAYRDFRQTPRGKKHAKILRNGNRANVPGRTHWPEADSIRKITGCSLKPPTGTPSSGVPADEDAHDHSTPVVPESLLPAFPKAVLGLPINFHFADGPGKLRPGDHTKDPQDVQLVPLVQDARGRWEPAERMASPVITRPLFLDGKWFPAVIVFSPAHLAELQARLVGERSMAGGGAVSQDIPHAQIEGPSLGVALPMRGQTSALEALMDYLTRSAGFSERSL